MSSLCKGEASDGVKGRKMFVMGEDGWGNKGGISVSAIILWPRSSSSAPGALGSIILNSNDAIVLSIF